MKRIIGHFLSLLLMAMPVITVAHAQPGDWAQVVEAAKKEGEVIVWGQAGDARRRFWKDSFEKAYPGIRVNLFQPSSSSERDPRLLREMEAGVAKVDVLVSGSGIMLALLKPKGALQPLRPLLRPDILEGRNWIDGEPLWNDDEKQYIITSDQPVSMVVVANARAPELRSWNDLLDPKWNGKIISLDPRASGQAFATTVAAFTLPQIGPDWVANMFAKGRVVFGADERQMLEWVEGGRMQLAFAIRDGEITALEKVGGKVRTYATLEAGGVQHGIIAGTEGAAGVPNINPLPHPNAARVYLNWFFSKDGQQAMVDTLGLASIHTGVDMKSVSQRTIRAPGAKYTSANSEAIVRATRAMRDTVAKAVEAK